MKKKILKNLNKLTNKEWPLLPEIRLRDEVYWDHLGGKPLLKKRFFSLFIESISDLSDSGEIICEDRNELFCRYPSPYKRKDPFPPYDSRINRKPSDYFLEEGNSDIYVGRKTKKCEEYIKSLKYIAKQTAKTV